jgi:hypothetical protein
MKGAANIQLYYITPKTIFAKTTFFSFNASKEAVEFSKKHSLRFLRNIFA